jgi:segregation and condensation protein A
MTRPRLGRDVFGRGEAQPLRVTKTHIYECSLYDLLFSYGKQRQKAEAEVHVAARTVMSLSEARDMLQKLIGLTIEWTALESFLTEYLVDKDKHTTVRASSFSAMLEMVKEGAAEISQDASFAPLYIRTKST